MQEDEQTTEVRQTDKQVGDTNIKRESVKQTTNVSGVVIAQRVIYYLGGVIIALLSLRLVFQLFGANQASGFVDFIYTVSGLFVAPFFGIFGEPTFGVSHFETSTLVAIVIYALLTIGIAKLLTVTRPNEEV
ncbi:MAG: YggT family protein [Candidatus Saccharibacteria bacterium]